MDHQSTVPSVGLFEAGKLFFKNAGTFAARSRRSEFWMAELFLWLLNIAAMFVLILLLSPLGDVGVIILYLILFFWNFYVFIAGLSLCVRRLHDIGKSGWNIFLGMIPLVGGIIMLVFYCTDSTEDNKWGPNPKFRTQEPPQDVLQEAPRALPQYESTDAFEPTVYEPQPAVPAAAPAAAVLSVCSGPMTGAIYFVESGKAMTIGRSGRCDIVLDNYNSVSGVHCQVTAYDSYITVSDLGSSNGTFVNGQRLAANQPVPLSGGSNFALADANCVIQVRFP